MKRCTLLSAFAAALVLLLLVGCLTGISRLETGQAQEGKQQLENALRRAAVACYAAEGAYPSSLSYLKDHYGVQINEEYYTVFYEVFAENLMPEITVLEKET